MGDVGLRAQASSDKITSSGSNAQPGDQSTMRSCTPQALRAWEGLGEGLETRNPPGKIPVSTGPQDQVAGRW